MDHGDMSKKLSKKARQLHKLGDRAVGSVLDAYKLNECSFLAPVRTLTVEIENVDEYLKTPLLKDRPPVAIRVTSGADDVGDQQQPTKTLLMRGMLNWSGGKVDFAKTGDPESKILFSIGFPNDKTAIGQGDKMRLPIAKIKSQGIQIFRINQPIDFGDDISKSGLEVIKVSDSGEISSAPYLKVCPKTSLITKMASFTGMSFEKTGFSCLYMATQKLATIRPIIGLVQNQIGYTVKFSSSPPYPEHQSKAVVLALATLLLMKVGPVDIERFVDLHA